MSSPGFERMQELFDRAKSMAPPQRDSFLAKECGGDVALHQQIERLLALNQAVATPVSMTTPVSETGRRPVLPKKIGTYKILGILGEGGMGVVYEATQEKPHRTVAIKVLRGGLLNEKLIRRFEFEAEVLGTLRHPGIAQVYDAGTEETPSGSHPYFVMERVYGHTLCEFVRQQSLAVHEVLGLFIKIGEAVHHAHQRGIIHRDLKPVNILVDAEGQPKVLDFGIARPTRSEVRASDWQTDSRQIIGTPPYMSPEQARGDVRDLDIRADVYSLGVILYELLTGCLPYELEGVSPAKALQIVVGTEPTPLGDRFAGLRGDLETIVGKALEKSKGRRYSSVVTFLADIRSFLENRPIAARRPGRGYLFRKFCARNRGFIVALGIIVFAVAVGFATSLYYLFSYRDQNQQTELLVELYEDMWAAPDPKLGFWHNITVREVLDHQAPVALQNLASYPLLRARFEQALGRTYLALGLFDQAEIFLERCSDRCEELLGAEHRTTLTAREDWARALCLGGKLEESEGWQRRVLEVRERRRGPDHPDTLTARTNLAQVLQHRGRFRDALMLYQDVLKRSERALGPDHAEVYSARANVAGALAAQGQFQDAQRLLESVLTGQERTLGKKHPNTLATINNLASTFLFQGGLNRARELFQTVLTIRQQKLGENHPNTLHSRNNLASVLHRQGEFGEAERIHRSVLESQKQILGEEHPDTLQSLDNLAAVLFSRGRFQEAREMHQEVLAVREPTLGAEHVDTLQTRNNIASILRAEGKYQESLDIHREVTEICKRTLGKKHPHTLQSRNNLAVVLTAQGKLGEALAECEDVLRLRQEVLGEKHGDTLKSQINLAAVLRAQGKTEAALRVQQEVLAIQEAVLGKDDPGTLACRNSLASTLHSLGRHEEALELSREVWKLRQQVLGTEHPDTLRSRRNIQAVWKAIESEYRSELETQQSADHVDHRAVLRATDQLAWFLWRNHDDFPTDNDDLPTDTRDEAYELLADAYRTAGSELEDGDLVAATLGLHYGMCLMGFEEYLEAEAVLRRAYVGFRLNLNPDDGRRQQGLRQLIRCLEELGDDEGANEYRREMRAEPEG